MPSLITKASVALIWSVIGQVTAGFPSGGSFTFSSGNFSCTGVFSIPNKPQGVPACREIHALLSHGDLEKLLIWNQDASGGYLDEHETPLKSTLQGSGEILSLSTCSGAQVNLCLSFNSAKFPGGLTVLFKDT